MQSTESIRTYYAAKRDAAVLPPYRQNSVFRYIADEGEANNALRKIQQGKIGFDTEQCERRGSVPVGPPATIHHIDWADAILCVIQLAIPGCVYIVDVKPIPKELVRILTSRDIWKTGCGLINDVNVLYQETGLQVQGLIDVGMMVKFANAEKYGEQDSGGLSLEKCVEETFGELLDKNHRYGFKWDEVITPDELKYAGLDAQASLELYFPAADALLEKSSKIRTVIHRDWYTFHSLKGKPQQMPVVPERKISRVLKL
ncbi:ribonuclease H-like domain-containing protein [Mycena alexandri]|uniref:3'-5' exonuclease n=1 Tax=Mycena alexandri TaxID=1745969 RepID=A0AAD6SVG1_9AGAR|nr:ribonuclease H-like domain-containing protein [Mycena alexandri]